MSDAFRPYYVEPVRDDIYVDSRRLSGTYLVLGQSFNAIHGVVSLTLADKATGQMFTAKVEHFKFKGLVKSCVLCEFPDYEGVGGS